MATIDEINAQVPNTHIMRPQFIKGELAALPGILMEGEQFLDAVQGRYQNGVGLLVATERRLIFVNKKMFGIQVEDFPLDKITTIQYETGLAAATIKILASGNTAVIDMINKDKAKGFADAARARISAPKPAITAAPAAPDLADQLMKLAALRDQGILSDEEFAAQKAKLLAS